MAVGGRKNSGGSTKILEVWTKGKKKMFWYVGNGSEVENKGSFKEKLQFPSSAQPRNHRASR